MESKVICMASAKGGSGKTLLTATFGAFLSAIGKKILLIDTDASTNGLTLLYLKEVVSRHRTLISTETKPKGIYNILNPDEPVAVVELDNGVHLLPATYEFTDLEVVSPYEFASSLMTALSKLKSRYHYIFIDAQAGSETFSRIVMSQYISDEVVIVSEYDPMSAAGVERLKALLSKDLTHDRTWLLLNKLLPEFVKSFSDFLEIVKYLSPIPWDSIVVIPFGLPDAPILW